MGATAGTLLDSGTGSGATATTGSVTTHANSLQLLAVLADHGSGGITVVEPTIIDSHGLTWVKVATIVGDGATFPRLTVFRSLKSTPTTGTRTVDFGGESESLIGWVWHEFPNVRTSGSNGSGAIVQVPTPTKGSSGTSSITLAAFADATNNAAYAAIGVYNAVTITADASGGYTIAQVAPGGIEQLGAEWKTGQDTTVTGTFSSNQWVTIGLEIQHGTPPAGRWPYDRGGRTRRTRQLPH